MGNQHKSDQVRVCLLFYLCRYHLYLKQLCHERRELLPKKFFLTIINDKSLTFTPQGSVASSNAFCITWLIVSLSDNISARFLVPRTFRKVVAAKSRVEWLNNEKKSYICTISIYTSSYTDYSLEIVYFYLRISNIYFHRTHSFLTLFLLQCHFHYASRLR